MKMLQNNKNLKRAMKMH